MLSVSDDLIQHNDAYLDTGSIARQLGLLPPAGSKAEARIRRLGNLRTRLRPGSRPASPSGWPTASGSSAAASRSRP